MPDISEYLWEVNSTNTLEEDVEIVIGKPQKEFIKQYLQQCDYDFYEPLSQRVDMDTFSSKLCELSTTFIVFKNHEVAGLICTYFYNPKSLKGFITLVHVRSKYRGQHLASKLIDSVKTYATNQGFRSIELFVSKQQSSAYNLYQHHGFEVLAEEKSGRCWMQCILQY
jgi:ribosomal protein S18 acetylase RimI-like enzyme